MTHNPTRPEPYLMLSKHYAIQGQTINEQRILTQALQKATDFHSYPER